MIETNAESCDVRIATALGDMIVTIATKRAPITSGYFLQAVQSGLYDGSSFYRIATGANQEAGLGTPIEIVQGGLKQPTEAVSPCIAHETTAQTGLRHRRGTISLARFAPGAVYHGFFLCRRREPALDFGGARQPDGLGFAAFGNLKIGFDVLDRIFEQAEPTEMLRREIPILSVKCL